MSKLDITSTAVEKSIDLAKDFLDKLITPALEESGLLLKDQITLWKFKNQIRVLSKAEKYCEKNNISPKVISLKLMCPLLDYAALEEDEKLQDKWALLLSNMVDSEKNIENHVFPYILSQISSNEFTLLENIFNDKIERIEKSKIEIEDFRKKKPELIEAIKTKIILLENEINLKKEEGNNRLDKSIWDLNREIKRLKFD